MEGNNEEKPKTELSFDANGNPTNDKGEPIVVSKEDLESISKQQTQVLNAQSVLGSLEVKKIELASQVIGLRKNLDTVIQIIMDKYGIPSNEANYYGINQRTGQILKNGPIKV